METWIIFTLLAVIMQSVRTAAQKQITQQISVHSATLVRFLFGIKFAALYFFLTVWIFEPINFELNNRFFLSGALASISQVLATIFLIKAFTLKNFAVGTALAKTEALLTAVLGSIFFSAYLNPMGYLSILFGVCGLLVASNWNVTFKNLSDNQSIRYGLGSGLGFALASLWIRDASLSLEIPRIVSAAAVLLYMVILQSVICLAWVTVKEPEQFVLIKKNLHSSLFIGFTGVLGSIGWFTAMSLQNVALVKTLGQVEFVASLLITYLYFNEKISTREYLGMALIALSILLLIGAA
ncbi:MAG: EamA family transporter [Gammaproteobacteria bacterium]|nr:EamA family transporter [Gammaproteobacteria bacterium]